jgi:hypothetical protein
MRTMRDQSSTALIWTGLLLSVIALLSYPFFFVRFPITRDVPWVNLLLFAVAAVVVVIGLRRAFALDATRGRRISAAIGATLSLMVFALFIFGVFVFARQLPASHGAPQVGQKAPEFQLPDANGKAVALSELLSAPINGQAPRGVLLVFYRGYW